MEMFELVKANKGVHFYAFVSQSVFVQWKFKAHIAMNLWEQT